MGRWDEWRIRRQQVVNALVKQLRQKNVVRVYQMMAKIHTFCDKVNAKIKERVAKEALAEKERLRRLKEEAERAEISEKSGEGESA